MTFGAIILAAGASSRMGQSKPLLPFAGQPMIVTVLQKYLSAALSRVVVVVEPQAKSLIHLLHNYSVQVAFNEQANRGMLSSVQVGLRALGQGTDAIIGLADQPSLTTATIARLTATRRFTGKSIIVPTHGGRGGHPILIGKKHFGEILCMNSAQTLKHFVRAHPREALWVAVPDAGVTQDIDDWETYQQELNR